MFTELHTQLTHWLTQTHDTVLARDLQPLLVTGRDVDLLGALALLDLHELLTPTERAAFNQSMAKGELPSLPKKAPELWLETHPEARDVAMALTRDYLTALLDDLEVAHARYSFLSCTGLRRGARTPSLSIPYTPGLPCGLRLRRELLR